VKINNLDTYCEQVGRRGKDYETKLHTFLKQILKIGMSSAENLMFAVTALVYLRFKN
jgi:hypothetical protein